MIMGCSVVVVLLCYDKMKFVHYIFFCVFHEWGLPEKLLVHGQV